LVSTVCVHAEEETIYFWDVGHPGHLLFARFFFLARHVTFWQWTLAAHHDCNFNMAFNIFCAAPSGHTVGMRHYGLF
jgi:hypothetical protein